MTTTVEQVRFEHHRESLGIGDSQPRISWTVQTDLDHWVQQAFEIQVTEAGGPDTDAESTGRVASAQSVLVPWPARPMGSRSRRRVRVRVWGNGGDGPSDWSEPADVETGLLAATDWTAQLITPNWPEDTSVDQPPALFRCEFDSPDDVVSARLYVTAHGVYEVELNGSVVGEDVLAPGWSSYRFRLRYHTYDVTDLVQPGRNALGATVAEGWYRGLLGFEGGQRNIYGDQLALLAQLEIRYADGSLQTVNTNQGWHAHTGPILSSGLYAGETYDARQELADWSRVGFAAGDWSGVRAEPAETDILVAPPGPPVRRIEELAPIALLTSPGGAIIADFGQNLVGRLRIRVPHGEAGQTITLRHAEVLDRGELGTRPLRLAQATDRYILSGESEEFWEPRFTYHGFRYAEITGWPGELTTDDLRAVVLHTDMERTGWFSCSDELINQLHQNVVWGMRGNFFDVPTDCPQRDERLGWTGDIQIFAPTARFLYDCTGMLESWLADVVAEQEELGTVPVYVPFIQLIFPAVPTAAWGDAAVVVPWVLYQCTGDLEQLRRQYRSMRAWVDQVAEAASDSHLWDSGLQLGDWLDPTAPPDHPADARTDRYLVATAYHAYTAAILAEVAALLEFPEDSRRYRMLAEAVRAAFAREFISANGRLVSDAPTAYALGLEFGLLDPEQRQRAGDRLVELVKAGDHRIATGFVGTPIICDALSHIDATDTAYHLLTQRECPSWLYPVTMGATTIWERWDSMLPDGSINPGDMTSFNHYALGAVADWLHRTVAGLALSSPGYRTFTVAPRPGGGLTHASAAHQTPYGRAEVSWTRERDRLSVEVVVPPGTSASVNLPADDWQPQTIGSGRHEFSCRYRPAESDPSIPTLDRFADIERH